MKTLTTIIATVIVSASLMIAGCGGGNPAPAAPAAQTVSGRVLAPNGVLASATLKSATVKKQQSTPVAGVTVKLGTVNDAGDIFTAYANATAVTNGQGQYTITVPNGVTFGPSLVVVVGPDNDPTLGNIVTGAEVDVTPAYFAAVNRLFDRASANGRAISGLNLTDVISFFISAVNAAANAQTGANVAEAVTNAGAAIDANATATAALTAVAGPARPAPTLIGINPPRVFTTGVNATLTGTNFASGATVNIIDMTGTIVTVSNVNVVSATQITATITVVDFPVGVGSHDVTVTVTVNGQTSNGVTWHVED